MKKFEVIFLTEARDFLLGLNEKVRDKIIFNIDKSKVKTDNELFKKLKGGISDIVQQNLLPDFCILGKRR